MVDDLPDPNVLDDPDFLGLVVVLLFLVHKMALRCLIDCGVMSQMRPVHIFDAATAVPGPCAGNVVTALTVFLVENIKTFWTQVANSS